MDNAGCIRVLADRLAAFCVDVLVQSGMRKTDSGPGKDDLAFDIRVRENRRAKGALRVQVVSGFIQTVV